MNQNNDVLEKYQGMQELQQQAKLMQEQLGTLEKQTGELETVKDTLTSIEKGNGNEDVLIPLGSGVFIKGMLKGNERIVMNVGADLVVEKSISDALKLVDEQVEKMGDIKGTISQEINDIMMNLQKLQVELQKAQQE
jgi:prefoldin alpha subunit